jgi:hypothetical protein
LCEVCASVIARRRARFLVLRQLVFEASDHSADLATVPLSRSGAGGGAHQHLEAFTQIERRERV